ncbi:MAG: hypothetical protein GY737_09330 [Desulfobacteraceae bacterium]|nr:hypothetical protein [Desulfobacteraceae bacterium]
MRQKIYLMLIPFYLLAAVSSRAGSKEEMALRLNFGLKIFPYIMATDSDLSSKMTDSGSFLILIIYRKERERAENLKQGIIKRGGTIKSIPIQAVTTDDLEKTVSDSGCPSAIFLSEYLPGETFQKIIDFAIMNRVIVFSPIIGDVKRGATAGIYLSTSTLPSLNLTTLKKSRIQIGKKLRKLSKKYQ